MFAMQVKRGKDTYRRKWNVEYVPTIGYCRFSSFTYAIGKLSIVLWPDHSNIKRFIAAGLIVSSVANLIVGLLGMTSGLAGLSSMAFFVCFFIMWAINGWCSIDGAGLHYCIISLVFRRKSGELIMDFRCMIIIGRFIFYIFVGSVVGWLGWQAGFVSSFIAGAIGVVIIIFFLHDSPESRGLPP